MNKNKVQFSWGYVENYANYDAHYSAVWVGGKNTTILPSFAGIKGLCERIQQRTGAESKIECIATLRSFSNLGLKEAKEIIEEIGLKKEPKKFTFKKDIAFTGANGEISVMAVDISAAWKELAKHVLATADWYIA